MQNFPKSHPPFLHSLTSFQPIEGEKNNFDFFCFLGHEEESRLAVAWENGNMILWDLYAKTPHFAGSPLGFPEKTKKRELLWVHVFALTPKRP